MKSILITGGSGSFGNAFAQFVIAGVSRVCIYSRGEHRQAAMREAFGDDDRMRFFVGDVRDRDRLRRAMIGVDVVVHAAALKRIEVGHYNPIEMVLTNVNGAINVIEAARDAKVRKVVALSTDKAVSPCSPYGYSKAMAEALFIAADDNHGTQFCVTRYGNIAASNGSVIPRWREMLDRGQHLEVTDPDCTRFWMTIGEAVRLVWDAILDSENGGKVIVPTLPAYRLGDLARAMDPVKPAIITGLPAWEKMHESMGPDNCSKDARCMTVEELREALKQV